MAIDISFRERAVGKLTKKIGVYILCDLDEVPIYVGQSTQGIRDRVQRHLTSARSDIVANRQLDVWEVAWVWAFPVETREEMNVLEAVLFHHFDSKSALINGTLPKLPATAVLIPEPEQKIQVMKDEEIAEKKESALRLPRQAEHYSQIVSHFLTVKNSAEIARAMQAHFVRLQKYHRSLLGLAAAEKAKDNEEN